MIDLETIQSQINSLQRCVDNHKKAISALSWQQTGLSLYTMDEIQQSKDMVKSTEQTLVGQLRVMNYQNEKLLK